MIILLPHISFDVKKERIETFYVYFYCLTVTDIDECNDTISNMCSGNATCINTVASYDCLCHNGYTGDGFNCSGKFNRISSSS